MRDRQVKQIFRTHPRYHRLDMEFDGAEPRLGNTKSMHEHAANVGTKDDYGVAALHGATASVHEVIVRLLLEHAVDVNAKDNRRETALHRAATSGLWRMPTRRITTETALHMAVESEAVVRVLLEHTADVTAKDNNHYCVRAHGVFWLA